MAYKGPFRPINPKKYKGICEALGLAPLSDAHHEYTKTILEEAKKSGTLIAPDPEGMRLKQWLSDNGSYWNGRVLTKQHKHNKSRAMQKFYASEKGKKQKQKLSDEFKRRGVKPPPNVHTKGTTWWNNGIQNKRAKVCPGEGFVLGRLSWK